MAYRAVTTYLPQSACCITLMHIVTKKNVMCGYMILWCWVQHAIYGFPWMHVSHDAVCWRYNERYARNVHSYTYLLKEIALCEFVSFYFEMLNVRLMLSEMCVTTYVRPNMNNTKEMWTPYSNTHIHIWIFLPVFPVQGNSEQRIHRCVGKVSLKYRLQHVCTHCM